MQAADWFALLGYLLLLLTVCVGIYQFLPRPKPVVEIPIREEAPAAVPRRSLVEWARLADKHEGYAIGHAERVAALALALADAVGLAETERGPLHQAALLHDVGEIDFEQDLLARGGPLSQAEFFRLWEHPARGAQLALEITGNQTVSQWVRWHHERWDGLGYPDGLVGPAIPLPARILRLADSADAMLHARPYRGAMSPDEAMAELTRLTAISYDPNLAKVFIHEVLPQFLEAATRPAAPPLNDWTDASFDET